MVSSIAQRFVERKREFRGGAMRTLRQFASQREPLRRGTLMILCRIPGLESTPWRFVN